MLTKLNSTLRNITFSLYALRILEISFHIYFLAFQHHFKSATFGVTTYKHFRHGVAIFFLVEHTFVIFLSFYQYLLLI